MCPLCKKTTTPEFRPFCSQKCADIDLGRWITGQYRVPSFHIEDPHGKEFTAIDRDAFSKEKEIPSQEA
ncbi:DNA gyrase inhibitor YacG [Acetobacteraceae bacterium ESL0709]|nr:DNA gyrase inhibitor YacG [Acetobacteraceae bacterium ESL0697]MDF7678998.1 DNA gyrase inhibitor YacG [Acetobacteraceae bacterium ESL0709]